MGSQARAATRVLTPNCLCIDLEVGVKDGRIHRFAAQRGRDRTEFVFHRGDVERGLAELDAFAEGCEFLLGHNILAFDRPHLAAVAPGLALLSLPVLDTLWLNPLAFPRNPYHHLVKHYQDGQLQRARFNDPLLDTALTLDLFDDQYRVLQGMRETAADLLLAWHGLCARGSRKEAGFGRYFRSLRAALDPTPEQLGMAIGRLLAGSACLTQARDILSQAQNGGWPLAYALAWLSVAGDNSVMPPWVRYQFPQACSLIQRLRDRACTDPTCAWCRERHDATRELRKWFGFSAFRPEPADKDGRPLQQAIVEAAMHGDHALGILPTGTGKSLCYQIPALSRFDKTGSLTVVISPLVALMADQVTGLQGRGIDSCVAISGLLSMPERGEALDRIRLGDAGIVIVAPEQLRSKTFRRVLGQREIGAWVLDEAHCLSKWGHDFRPDYRYVGRFIRERACDGPIPPILCLTATAKPDVVQDIVAHFQGELGVVLKVFDGGARRDNLDFAVVPTSPAEKFPHVAKLLLDHLPEGAEGGAIMYCASRRRTEDLAAFLREAGIHAKHFHAGLSGEAKTDTQRQFIEGALRVMVATNAFGMGIDKPNVRLVVHADVPGSLENYLQEAGRAGRDRLAATCILLYTPEDIERQFGLSARARLTQAEIQSILRALRSLERRKKARPDESVEVIVTTGEILLEDEARDFERDTATDDTRVRTAVAWLEESRLLMREENHVQVFPSSLRIASLDEAAAKLQGRIPQGEYQRQLLSLVEVLMNADADEGVSTDELMAATGLASSGVRKALFDLEALGIARNDTALTAFVHAGVERSSKRRLERIVALEGVLIERLRESAPDLAKGEPSVLHIRHLTQRLKDDGHPDALPEIVARCLRGIALGGRDDDGGTANMTLKRLDAEAIELRLNREWGRIIEGVEVRRNAAGLLLDHLLQTLPSGARGIDLLAQTTLGELTQVLRTDVTVGASVRPDKLGKLLDRGLLWLHELEVIRLNKGLAVFRPAMTIRLQRERRAFGKVEFQPLQIHYQEQVLQIHVMAEYVQRGLNAMADALRLAMDYFQLPQQEFLVRWLPGRDKELERQTTPESWQAIVGSLRNPVQQRIVADDREQSNVLVLAGPGSGKTRALVHRIAYLVRVRRENSHGILALTYNRSAAGEIRRRLNTLIGDDAKGVLVMTGHALAMRLVGASFEGRALRAGDDERDFDAILDEAVALLQGRGLPQDEADAQRDRLLRGFRWILVDEYQDIDERLYALIGALAGRTLQDAEQKLSLFAVGDDDQNIYAFRGARVEFIRRFEMDYAARPIYLVENYRSTKHIIAAANAVIAAAPDRMKVDHPITIVDRARAKRPPGGEWATLDLVVQGRVQVLRCSHDPKEQALAVIAEWQRMQALAPGWDWARCALLARNWNALNPALALCTRLGIPAQKADAKPIPFWRLREVQSMLEAFPNQGLITAEMLQAWVAHQPASPWIDMLRLAVTEFGLEAGELPISTAFFREWLAEWGRGQRQVQKGVLLTTAHGAKGLEFDHVAVLDGGWEGALDDDADAARRLFYVAMTRAIETLTLVCAAGHPFLGRLDGDDSVLWRQAPIPTHVLGGMDRIIDPLSLSDVDLSFAGRKPASDRIHGALAHLRVGDVIELVWRGEAGELIDRHGNRVGKLARAYLAHPGHQCVHATVRAVVRWTAEDSEPEYRSRLRVDAWEVIVPELVFEPSKG
ncbi:RecQ family ATP-dependent DNA helicase [Thiomonas sp. FB-Cd]|uniref:RecQ family ATP-dependent DNA helicase n=1 Tax=Thiomonas sp. FB-Cd TaxID=1158292 RepID=UPI0004DEDAB2|nr:RecQ family ATP-dependent DNA helicase [Thiomonas sp. FB-Cd]